MVNTKRAIIIIIIIIIIINKKTVTSTVRWCTHSLEFELLSSPLSQIGSLRAENPYFGLLVSSDTSNPNAQN